MPGRFVVERDELPDVHLLERFVVVGEQGENVDELPEFALVFGREFSLDPEFAIARENVVDRAVEFRA